MVVERLLIRRLYDKEPLVSLIVTFALALMIEALLRLIYGGIGQPFNQPPIFSGIYLWGPVLITKYRADGVRHHGGAAGRRCGRSCSSPRSAASCAPARAIRRWSGLLGIRLPRVLTAVFGLGCAHRRHRRACWRRRCGR